MHTSAISRVFFFTMRYVYSFNVMKKKREMLDAAAIFSLLEAYRSQFDRVSDS